MSIPVWGSPTAVTLLNGGATVSGTNGGWGSYVRDSSGILLTATPVTLSVKSDVASSQTLHGFIQHGNAHVGFSSPEYGVNMDGGFLYKVYLGAYTLITTGVLSTDVIDMVLSTAGCVIKKNGTAIYTFPITPLGATYDIDVACYGFGILNNIDFNGGAAPVILGRALLPFL